MKTYKTTITLRTGMVETHEGKLEAETLVSLGAIYAEYKFIDEDYPDIGFILLEKWSSKRGWYEIQTENKKPHEA